MTTIRVTHYSDILCIWAYVSQKRIEELQANFTEQISVDYCLFSVFGAAQDKIATNWANRGDLLGYNNHVLEIGERFDHIPIHQDIWLKSRPSSSLPAHLYLLATKLLERDNQIPKGSSALLAKNMRQAFFAELIDISNDDNLSALVKQADLPLKDIQQKFNSGEAFAELAANMQQAQNLSIRSSPTLLFNEDRQRLTGNVGYRIIEANIRELLEQPDEQQTWC